LYAGIGRNLHRTIQMQIQKPILFTVKKNSVKDLYIYYNV